MVRMTLMELEAALAGVMLNASFATFTASMAAFKEERAASRRFCRWNFMPVDETGGSWERKV